jgi:hypothetical protein
MGHSILMHHGRHLILNDGDLLIVMGAMYDEILSHPGNYPTINQLVDHIADNRQGWGPGLIDLPLDQITQRPEGRAELASLLGRVEHLLVSLGPTLPEEHAHRWAVKGLIWMDRELEPAITATRELSELVRSA